MTKRICLSVLGAFTLGFVLTFAFPPPKEAQAQVFGPTTRTPQLTVGPGPTTVQDITIQGTCTGCGGGSVTETTGSFTASYDDACTTTPNALVTWSKIGKIVTMDVSGVVTCTSDSTAFRDTTVGRVPVALRPAAGDSIVSPMTFAINNTSSRNASVLIGQDGEFSIQLCPSGAQGSAACSTSGWTNTGSKGYAAFYFSYVVP